MSKKKINIPDDLFETQANKRLKELLAFYNESYSRIAKQIHSLELSGLLTKEEMSKRNRLVTLNAQIDAEVERLTGKSIKLNRAAIGESFTEGYYTTGYVLETSTGVSFNFALLPTKSIEGVIFDSTWVDRLSRHSADLQIGLKDAIKKGLNNGSPYREIIKSIDERYGAVYSNSKTLTFTEMHRANSTGRLEGIKRAQEAGSRLGLEVEKVWKYNNAAKEPREEHKDADGMIADNEGMFHIGGELLEAPGLGEDPANNINCHCSSQVQIKGLENIVPDQKLLTLEDAKAWKDNL